MPSRNVIKVDIAESFYHVYARGHGRQAIFRDDADFDAFLNLFEQRLSIEPKRDRLGRPYAHLRGSIELLAYCLISDHFHLLVYQRDAGTMQRLMRGVLTSYSMYFNHRHGSSGALFESRYKASRLSSPASIRLVSRYIHLVPGNWQAHPYSSIHAYFGIGQTEWLQQDKVAALFESMPVYADFLDDHEDVERAFDDIKYELADFTTPRRAEK